MDCRMPGFPVLHYLLEFVQTHVHWVRDAIQPSHPLSSPSPAFNFSQHQGLFQWVSSSHRVTKVLGFSFSIIPSNEYSGLVSFRIDWFHLLTVQTTLKGISLCRGFCVLEEDDRKGMTNPPESICKHFLSSSSEGIWENHRKGTRASCTTLPSGTRVL